MKSVAVMLVVSTEVVTAKALSGSMLAFHKIACLYLPIYSLGMSRRGEGIPLVLGE